MFFRGDFLPPELWRRMNQSWISANVPLKDIDPPGIESGSSR
jgi:hypothetical protein